VAPGTGNSDMFVMFAGAGHRFAVNWLLFARPDVHVVLLRDHSFGGYVSGLRGVGSTFGECLKWLDWVRGDLGAPRAHMLGLSMGGYGALRWGLEQGATTVTSFSSPTNIVLDEVHPEDHADIPFYRRVFSHAPVEAKDCRRLYDAAASVPRTRLFYGEQHVRDARWARNMQGVRNCTLEAVPGCDNHYTFGHLSSRGSLPGLMNALLAEGK
jgi:pimeloyl-ACP methyl ester carboxylesterase